MEKNIYNIIDNTELKNESVKLKKYNELIESRIKKFRNLLYKNNDKLFMAIVRNSKEEFRVVKSNGVIIESQS
jgi:hypothetical protein